LIAVDTSSYSRYIGGIEDRTTRLVYDALAAHDAFLPPIVLTELLSQPALPADWQKSLKRLPLLPLRPTYWERAGTLRATLLRAGFKAKLADCLIAQSCIDSAAPLITYDRDFRHFAAAGLRLL
jgi:predicted nucleic acid-binding protein